MYGEELQKQSMASRKFVSIADRHCQEMHLVLNGSVVISWWIMDFSEHGLFIFFTTKSFQKVETEKQMSLLVIKLVPSVRFMVNREPCLSSFNSSYWSKSLKHIFLSGPDKIHTVSYHWMGKWYFHSRNLNTVTIFILSYFYQGWKELILVFCWNQWMTL